MLSRDKFSKQFMYFAPPCYPDAGFHSRPSASSQAFILTPVILRCCGTMIALLRKWKKAPKVEKKSDVADSVVVPDW